MHIAYKILIRRNIFGSLSDTYSSNSHFRFQDIIKTFLELLVTFKVYQRHNSALIFLDLIEIVIEWWWIADAKNGYCVVNWVFHVSLPTVSYVKHHFGMCCGVKKKKVKISHEFELGKKCLWFYGRLRKNIFKLKSFIF